MTTLFVSTMVYALGKELGFADAVAEFHRQLAAPDRESLPVVRVIARLRNFHEFALSVDAASVRIAVSRSRAFHAALESKADVWLSIDDDVEAETSTLRALIEAVEGNDPRICFAPYWQRGSERIAAQLAAVPLARALRSGAVTLSAVAGGFGLVAVNRAALEAIAEYCAADLRYVDADHVHRLAAFQESLVDGRWLGEDVSFFRRAAAAGVRIEALASGAVAHDGRVLRLEEIGTLPRSELV
jgi:GT2 family glycosyltransferase